MKPACRNCWDPVDRDGAELCDWCASPPEVRKQHERKALAIAALCVLLILIAAIYGACK